MSAEYNQELYKLKAELCKTFADPNRLIIINELRNSEKQVGKLVQILQIPQAVVSRHLAILRNKGIVKARRQGTKVYYSLTDPKIGEACDMVHQVLLNNLERNRDLVKNIVK
ncbi:ArsR/SmtB family transcription factor [Chloroflexota bacterium]